MACHCCLCLHNLPYLLRCLCSTLLGYPWFVLTSSMQVSYTVVASPMAMEALVAATLHIVASSLASLAATMAPTMSPRDSFELNSAIAATDYVVIDAGSLISCSLNSSYAAVHSACIFSNAFLTAASISAKAGAKTSSSIIRLRMPQCNQGSEGRERASNHPIWYGPKYKRAARGGGWSGDAYVPKCRASSEQCW